MSEIEAKIIVGQKKPEEKIYRDEQEGQKEVFKERCAAFCMSTTKKTH